MATVALPISSLVNVSVSVAAAPAQAQNTTSLVVMTNNAQVDTDVRLVKYSSLGDIGDIFGGDSIEYQAATAWFGQIPSPTDILIGRWAKTASNGCLFGGALSLSEQNIDNWTHFTGATFNMAVNGFPAVPVGPINLANETNLNGVASQLRAAMTAAGVQATVSWTGSSFRFCSSVTGPCSQVSFITPMSPANANDIAGMLKASGTAVGARAVAGVDAESATDALNAMDVKFGYHWYAMVIPEADDQDQIECAAAVQAMGTKHFFGITTQDPNVLMATSTGDIAYKLSEMALTRCAIQYSSSSAFAVCSLLGRILTTDYTQNSSVITLMYKQQPGILAEYLNRQQMDTLLSKNCNVFVAYQGGALIIQPGTTTSTNNFIDTVVGLDNLAIDVQIALFNLLYATSTKVPQTDAGMNQLVGAADTICLRYVSNGLIAPGLWTDQGFGNIVPGSFLDKGYYIFAPPIAQQPAADRAARMAGPMRIAVKLAGAIHTIAATIEVNP